MRRRSGALAAAMAAALLVPATAQAGDLRLAPVGKPRFPDRAFALALPAAKTLTARQVTVRENGRSVSRVSLLPASAAGGHLGVMLVIDASTSMRGEAIQGAMDAALTLAARRKANQRLGVVMFANRPATLLRPTSNPAKINAALSQPPKLEGGTRIFDAVRASIGVMERAGISGGSVVVLSDGADVGSRLSAEHVATVARDSGVRVYTVGLRSRVFRAGPLQDLASATGASYSEASYPAQLRRIYDQLGSELASEYLIRYRSPAGPRQRVRVTTIVDGFSGAASADYTTPALRVPAAAPFRRSLEESFWRSQAAIAVVSVLTAGLLSFALFLLLRPRSRARSLQRRLDPFVSSSQPREPASLAGMTDRVLLETEKSLERTSWWPAVKEQIELSRIPLAPVHLVALTVLGTILVGWLLSEVTGSPSMGLLALGTPLIVRMLVRFQVARQRNRFADQLADHIQVVASALRAGHSFVGALAASNQDAPEPTRTEFERAVREERLGVPVEDALDRITERMESPDMPHVALSAKLQRETGSNAAEVLDRVTATIRVRQELRREVRSLTAQQRMARGVLTALPIILLGVLSLLNPDYIEPLFQESLGRVMLVIAALGMLVGSWVMKRLVEIKV